MLEGIRRFAQIRRFENGGEYVHAVFEAEEMPVFDPNIDIHDVTGHPQFDDIQEGWLYNRLLDTYGPQLESVHNADEIHESQLEIMMALTDVATALKDIHRRLNSLENQ